MTLILALVGGGLVGLYVLATDQPWWATLMLYLGVCAMCVAFSQ